MTVKRIVTNIATTTPDSLAQFYRELLDLETVMDMGWIVTCAADEKAAIQISFASEGGSNTPVPDMSIEVDNIDDVYRRAQQAGHEITYPITDEPWGVRRFYVTDPAGKTLNILTHQ
jgi:predicted enzyme related to lactoylglutathione lyase